MKKSSLRAQAMKRTHCVRSLMVSRLSFWGVGVGWDGRAVPCSYNTNT